MTSNEPIEWLTTNISDTERVAVYYDEWLCSIEDLTGEGYGVYSIRKPNHLGDIKSGPLSDELDRLTRYLEPHQEPSAIGKYLTLSGMNYHQHALRGSSQSDWAEVFVYGDGDWIKEATNALDAWFRGDVYYVRHEKLITYTADDGTTITQWRDEDAISGITGDTAEEILEIARDNFDLGG